MTAEREQPGSLTPASNDLAFFGKITASVTHELNNVVAIIDQTAGLLNDLIAGEERGIPISTDRLAAASASIHRQAQRGLTIIEHLNRFAHCTDSTAASFDLNETLSNLIELSRRPAGLRRVHLQFSPAPAPVSITGNPFAILGLVFGSLQAAMTGCSVTDATITLSIQPVPDGAAVTVWYPGDARPDERRAVSLNAAAQSCGARIQVDSAPEGMTIRLRFPASPPG